MKPTWTGWAEVYAAQQVDVSTTEDCLYSGRWTEHNDLEWGKWLTSFETPPVSWNYCSLQELAEVDISMHLWLNSAAKKLWNPVQPEEYDTIWYPVIYPN